MALGATPWTGNVGGKSGKGSGVQPGGLGGPVPQGGYAPGNGGDVGVKKAPGPSAAQRWIWTGVANAGNAAGGAAPAAAPPSTPSPYDAQYFVNLAQATNQANNSIAGLQRNIDNGQTNLTNTLAQLEYNRGLSQTRAQNAENQRGGFAQGALGQQLGQISHQFLTTENNDTLRYQQDKANWEAAIAAVQQGLPVETIALRLASGQRMAALGLEAPPDAPAPSSGPTQAQVQAWVTAGSGPPHPISTAPERRSRSGGGGRRRNGPSGIRPGGL